MTTEKIATIRDESQAMRAVAVAVTDGDLDALEAIRKQVHFHCPVAGRDELENLIAVIREALPSPVPTSPLVASLQEEVAHLQNTIDNYPLGEMGDEFAEQILKADKLEAENKELRDLVQEIKHLRILVGESLNAFQMIRDEANLPRVAPATTAKVYNVWNRLKEYTK